MSQSLTRQIISRLRILAEQGPVPAKSSSPKSIRDAVFGRIEADRKLLDLLKGWGGLLRISRLSSTGKQTRSNLFAAVPNWSLSPLKSSAEILSKFGYQSESGRKLFCTLRYKCPNPQGLFLSVDESKNHLLECYSCDSEEEEVAIWDIDQLRTRLATSCSRSLILYCKVFRREDFNSFLPVRALFHSDVREDLFSEHIKRGIISVDHLISEIDGRVSEKGPLFKVNPKSYSSMFDHYELHDL